MFATRTALLACLFGLAVEVYLLAFNYTTHVEARGPHQVLLKEFGAGIPLSETFTMQNNGLKGIRVRLAASEPADVMFDWRLSEQRPPGWMSVSGNRQQLRVSGERWVDLRFPAIAPSGHKLYKLEIRAVAPTSNAVAIVASLDDALPGARFEVGGQERWGDLVMNTVATGDTIVGRVWLATRAGEESFQGVLLVAAALGLYNVLLATFVAHFWPRTAATLPASESIAGRRWPASRAAGVACVCVVVAGATVYASRSRRPAIDLIDQLYAAELHATLELHLAIVPTELAVGRESMRSIAAHPQSEIAWTVIVPSGARLRTAIATVPMVWSLPGDGVVFRIGVSDNGAYSELFAHHLDPARVPADRRWVPVDLDLSQFSGRRIRLIFKTDASVPGRPPDFNYDWARWGAPRLVAR